MSNYNTSPELYRPLAAEGVVLHLIEGHVLQGSDTIGRFSSDADAAACLTEAGFEREAYRWLPKKPTPTIEANTEAKTLAPAPYDLDAIKKRLQALLTVNKVKKNSAKGRTIEYGYVNALVLVYGPNPYLTLCCLSGRSILD